MGGAAGEVGRSPAAGPARVGVFAIARNLRRATEALAAREIGKRQTLGSWTAIEETNGSAHGVRAVHPSDCYPALGCKGREEQFTDQYIKI